MLNKKSIDAMNAKSQREAATARSRHISLPKPKRQPIPATKLSGITTAVSEQRKPLAGTQPFTGF